MNQEFLRMQKLAGIKPAQEDYNEVINILTEVHLYTHYYSKGILKENINEINLKGIASKIKDKFSKLPLKAKQSTKKVVDAIKSTGFNPVEVIGDASKIKREDIKKALDSIRATQTLNLAKKLQEAEGDSTTPEFTDISQLKDLKPGNSFIWKGKENLGAKWNGQKIEVNSAQNKFGLIPNTEYIVQPPSIIMLGPDGEEEPVEVPAQIWAKKEVEYLAKSEGGSKIMKFFRFVGKKLGGEKALGILGAVSALGGAIGQGLSFLADTDLQAFYDTGAVASRDTQGVVDVADQAAKDLIDNIDGEGDNEINKPLPTSGKVYNGEIDDSEVIRSLDANNVDTQGLEVTDNTATTQTYATGEGTLNDAGINDAADELAEKTIEDLNIQLDDAEGENLTKISLKIKYGAAVSHNQGADSNVSNDGGDLLDQRLESSEKVAKLAAQKVQDVITKTYGDNINIDISFEKVDNHNSIDDQKIQTAEDFLETQSSFQSSESNIETSTKEGEPITLLYYQFLAEPDKLGSTPLGIKKGEQGKKPDEKPSGEPKSTSSKIVPTPPPSTPTNSEAERDIKAIANLNRQSQIAFLLAKTSPGENQENPGLNLFKALGLNTSTNITAGELNSIADQGIYKEKEVSMEAEDLAKAIRRLVKSKPTIINAYAKLTGVKTKEKAARASITQKGVKGKSASAPIKEGFSNLTQLLSEAADDININNLLKSIGSLSTQQAAYLAKLVNVMYVGDQGGDVLDSESSEDKNFKVEYDKIQSPLASREKGEKYVFLDKKQDQVKPQSDADRLGSEVGKNKIVTTDLIRINTQDEVRDLIVQLVSLLNPNLVQDKSNLKTIMFGVRNRLKEAVSNDVSRVVKDILRNPTIVNRFKNINSVEEAVQAILREILPFLNPVMFTKKGDQVTSSTALKNAVIGATNIITSPKFIPSDIEQK